MKKSLIMGALVLLLGQASAAAASVGPSTTAGAMRPWSAQYMDGPRPVTLGQAIADAKAFNVIAAHESAYPTHVAAMKAANPNLQLFVYMKGVFTTETRFEESVYAHDVKGQRIQGVQFPGTWLLDPVSPRTLTRQIKRANMLLASSGYDGVFLDTIGTAPLGAGYVTNPPINPATGDVWTAADWLAANASLAGKIAAAIGKPVVGNGLRDGRNYFDPGTRVLLGTGMDAAMAEGWLRGATNPITAYPSERGWKLNLDALADAGANGYSFLAVTKLWTDGTQDQKDAWYRFAIASFLLANDGQAYLSVSYAPGDGAVEYSLNHLDLGAPNGPYAKVDNVYQRRFSLGRVLVNPSSTNTYTVQLGATYHTLDGGLVTSVTLPPDTSQILND